LDVARFWLDRGVDGFRLDTVNFYFHDNELRDNPSLSANQRNSNIAPAVNPYNFQEHLYSKNRPENLGFLKRLRDLMEEYPAVTSVGEVGDSLRGMEIQNEYTSGGDKLHMCYDFELLSGDSAPDGLRIRDVMSRAAEIVVDGWACWAHSNHDVARHASRWHLNEDARRLYAALLMSLRGSVCLYQGEELGLTEAEVGFDDLQDPYGKRFWPKFKGRDGCRTPIPWTDQAPYGGFSDSKPWLPMAPEHLERAVSLQSDDAESTHAFYKAFLAFRRHHDVLRKGSLQLTGDRADMVAFVREYEGERMTCAFNLSDREITVALPPGEWKAAPSAPFKTQCTGSGVTLPAYQAYFGIQSA
jgi:alpha-glucosidase